MNSELSFTHLINVTDFVVAFETSVHTALLDLDDQRIRVTHRLSKLKCLRSSLRPGILQEEDFGAKVLRLNVGEKLLNIRIDSIKNLSIHNWNLFLASLSCQWNDLLIKDKNGRVFLDLDEKWIEPVLIHLRNDSMQASTGVPSCDMISIPRDCHLGVQSVISKYRMESLFQPFLGLSYTSTICCLNDKNLLSQLKGFLPPALESPHMHLRLLYRGSKDGFNAAAFHSACDGQSNTICVVEDDQGNVFGGFADVPWTSTLKWIASVGNIAFLFSLHSISSRNTPMKFPISKNQKYAFHHDPNSLCAFGGGQDLLIKSDCNMHSDNVSNVSFTYSRKSRLDRLVGTGMDGKQNFRVREIEVYDVQDCKLLLHTSSSFPTRNIDESSLLQCELSTTNAKTSQLSSLHELCKKQMRDIHELVDREERQFLEEVRFILHLVTSENALGAVRSFPRSELDYSRKTSLFAMSSGDTDSSCVHDEDSSSQVLLEIEKCLFQLQALVDKKQNCAVHADGIGCNRYPEDEVVSFNVGGNIISTLRSTLLLAAPESFLARRVSGLWTEQRDDVEDDGNIFQNVHLNSFVRIINYLRLRMLLGDDSANKILVPEDEVRHLEALLSYYCMSDVPYEVLK